MSNTFVTIKNIFTGGFYYSTSIENRNAVKDCSNYAKMIKKIIVKIINLNVWLNVKEPHFLELLH